MKHIFKKYPIYYLLYGGFSGFMVILLVVVIGLAYSLSAQEMVKNTSYYQQNVLNELNSKIGIQMRSFEQTSLAASRNPLLSDYSQSKDNYSDHTRSAEIEEFLANITYATPMISSIQFYTKNAIPSQSQTPVVFIEEEKARKEIWYDWVQKADFTWIGERMITLFNGEFAVISFARKVYSPSGEYSGLLLLNIKAAAIQALVQGETADANRILLDSGGRAITSIGDPELRDNLGDFLPSMNDESGYLRVKTEGYTLANANSHLMVWSKHFNSDWTIVEFTPWKQITSSSVHNAFILSLVGILTIFLALFFTLLFSNQFIKPIRLLLHEMGRYTTNANKVKLPEDYTNEYGVLFSGYRKLMDRIQELYQSLENQYKRQKKAEIKALQAMINPHFLYNTLDQLNWMALGAGHDKMSEILELMGKMFRIGLSNGESLITIREELMHASCYMQIQQLRWEEGLTVQVEVPEHLEAFYIPKMTLQPFIENAIMHGFDGRAAGSIRIHAAREPYAEAIMITIADDGVGLKANWNSDKNGKTGGYGIRNVKERFEAFFGAAYGIEIRNKEPVGGVVVFIRIPLLSNQHDNIGTFSHNLPPLF
ncbi:sensor histidine kinase [Paenibacillus sepulcri]|uniref:Sensor histidine kinase n=1 Tax=Paenibacillus sepulcri TaxID=359917 RepID=A0ABS7BXM7_9BACL|nr:sensor histidine kinase [Paenibacillus sepulcri]